MLPLEVSPNTTTSTAPEDPPVETLGTSHTTKRGGSERLGESNTPGKHWSSKLQALLVPQSL